MAFLDILSNVTTQANTLADLILVSPNENKGYQPLNKQSGGLGTLNPLTKQSPPSFLFHYEGENTVSLESDITDHFIEDNTAIEDQIALKPEMITVHGYIGELNNVPPKLLAAASFINDKLGVVGAYVPGLTATAQNAYNTAFQLYQTASNVADSAVSAWNSLTGSGDKPTQNKQQLAFQQFYGYYRSRTLFNVQTPWGVFQNCAIAKLRALQTEETRVITEFEVTFKVLRFASTQNTPSNLSAGRLQAQAAGATNLGTSVPTSVPAPTQVQALAKVG